ncbi:MAG: DUF456 family protein [Halanaerobiales bacterium]|nr:DUF456 family protein [Halanaerobiales bacterium]
MLILLKIITLILAVVGVLGTIIPLIPGATLILLGAVVYGIGTDFNGFSLTELLIFGGITLLAEGIDKIFSLIGAKKFGASKIGLMGGMVGLLIGIFTMGPIGIFLGPLGGAVLAELIVGRPFDQAIRVGLGSLIGVLGGTITTFFISLFLAGWVVIRIFI